MNINSKITENKVRNKDEKVMRQAQKIQKMTENNQQLNSKVMKNKIIKVVRNNIRRISL